MSRFHSVFAGLPPCFTDRVDIDADTLFKPVNGPILQDERNDYLEDTTRFYEMEWLPPPSAPREVIPLLSFIQTVASHMNDSQRVNRLNQYTLNSISSGNAQDIGNLRRGILWGLNSMFPQAYQLERASTRKQQERRNRTYRTMINTVEYLNNDQFTLPDLNSTTPLRRSDAKSQLIERSSGSCELSGAKFLSRDSSRSAANCLEAHIIPSKMCLLSDEGSGVFAWLVLAILLSKNQFDSVWGECIGGKTNNPANLLLLLDEIEFSYDAAEFKLAYCRGENAAYPLLRCDFSTAVDNGNLLTMGFEWLKTRQPDYWGARRIDPESRSNISLRQHLTIIPPDCPTIIHYLNFTSESTASPSPFLLDAHNIMASLHVMVDDSINTTRSDFPLDASIWAPFQRAPQSSPRSNSRQRSHTSASSTRGGRSMSSQWGHTPNQSGKARYTTIADTDSTPATSNSSFGSAIDNYLKAREDLYQSGRELSYNSGFEQSSLMSTIRGNAVISAWLEGLS